MSDTMPDAVASPPAGKPLLDLTAAVLVVAFLAVGTWASYWAELRNDQYQLINLGECVYHGGKLYHDCWENKPPGLAWINALGLVLTPGGQLGVWVLPGVAALLCIVPLWYSVSRLLSPTAARRTAVLAAVLFTMRLYDAPSINPDFYSAILELAACALWLPAVFASFAGRRFAFGLLAGLFWSAATCVKQTGWVGLFAVTLVALALLAAKNVYGRRWLITALYAWVGFALGGAAVIVMLTREGTHQAAWDAVFAFNHDFLTWGALPSSAHSWLRLQEKLQPLQLPLWLALVGIVVTLSTRQAHRLSRTSVSAMVLWWLGAVVLSLMGPSRSMRYWQATFPPMIFLAAVGLYHLEEAFRQLDKGYRTALVLVSATAMVLLAHPLLEHYKLGVATSYLAYTQEPSQRERLADLGNQIQALVPMGERLYVAAYDAGVYVHADRRSACRFTYPRSAEQMQEILSDLAAGKAYALLIPERPALEFEHWCDATYHDQWNRLLDNYNPVLFVGPYKMWILKRPERPNPP